MALDELFDIALEERQTLDQDGGKVITHLVQAILPFLHASDDAEAIRSFNAAEPRILQLHTSHKTIAELIVAKAHERPSAFVPITDPNEFPDSYACILPYPHEGWSDPTGQQFKRDFIEHLRKRFTDPNNPSKNDEALTYWIRDGLRRDANRRVREYLPARIRFTYYFLVETPPQQSDKELNTQNLIINELATSFPEIAFLRLAPPDPFQRELQDYSLLRDLLYTKPV